LDGKVLSAREGTDDETSEGELLEPSLGDWEATLLGLSDGAGDGTSLRTTVGLLDGEVLGSTEGIDDGT